MIKALLCCLLLTQVADPNALTPAESKHLAELTVGAEKRWEKEIKGLEELDAKQKVSSNSILFIGSSSIRLWESIEEDMAPWPTIRRGYGGAKFSDLVVFAERLTKNHNYRALVVFVGNDITGGTDDKTPEQVLALYQMLVKLARKSHPDKPIFFIAITPTSKRFHVWDKISQVNRLVKEYSATDPRLHFIETESFYINEQGRPRDELFIEDKLHQNRAGYKLWASIIKPALAANLGTADASVSR